MAPQTLRLIETLHGLPDGDPETLRAHYRKYGCEILG
jgi:hypothetical protein